MINEDQLEQLCLEWFREGGETDKKQHHFLLPSKLDATVTLIKHYARFEPQEGGVF